MFGRPLLFALAIFAQLAHPAESVSLTTPKGTMLVDARVETSPTGPVLLMKIENKTFFVWDYITLRFSAEGSAPFEETAYLVWDKEVVRLRRRENVGKVPRLIGAPLTIKFADGKASDPREKRRSLLRLACDEALVQDSIDSMRRADAEMFGRVLTQLIEELNAELPPAALGALVAREGIAGLFRAKCLPLLPSFLEIEEAKKRDDKKLP